MAKQEASFAVFVDFDGTINVTDLGDLIREKYLTARDLKKAVSLEEAAKQGEITVREHLIQQWGMIEATPDDILNFSLNNIIIRDGFEDFVSFIDKNHGYLSIVSDGLQLYIRPILETLFSSYPNLNYDIFSNDSVSDSKLIDLRIPTTCDHGCALCKFNIVRQFKKDHHVPTFYVGDGLSDWKGSLAADVIFSIEGKSLSLMLKSHPKTKNKEVLYYDITTFHEVVDGIRKTLN